MQKTKFYIIILLAGFLMTSCDYIVEKLQKNENNNDTTIVSDITIANENEIKVEKQYLGNHSICISQQDTLNGKQRAIKSIEYALKMYKPDLRYTNIRAVAINDGTFDVIIDFNSRYTHEVYHTYYNVTLGEGDNFEINDMHGNSEGYWPYQ